jgi:hypothetical protein
MLAALCCPALARRSVRWRALDRRRGTLRGPAFARAMVPSVLLVHRHQWSGGQCTRIQPQPVEHWQHSHSELAEFCGCPAEALRFSRVGPVHLAHGGAWARLEALDSLRWPFLDAPVIHGPAVAVRPVLGCGGVDRPGQDPGGSGAPAWRALDPWEAENALWALRRYVLPLQPLSCPVDQAFLNSISWPLHRAHREALRVGDATTMLSIRLEVQRERSAWALARG